MASGGARGGSPALPGGLRPRQPPPQGGEARGRPRSTGGAGASSGCGVAPGWAGRNKPPVELGLLNLLSFFKKIIYIFFLGRKAITSEFLVALRSLSCGPYRNPFSGQRRRPLMPPPCSPEPPVRPGGVWETAV